MLKQDQPTPIREFGESGICLVHVQDIGTQKPVLSISKLKGRKLYLYEIRASRYVDITDKLVTSEAHEDELLYHDFSISDFYYLREVTDREKAIIRVQDDTVYLILDRSDF